MSALPRHDAAPVILHFPAIYQPPAEPIPAPAAHTSPTGVRKPKNGRKSNPDQAELWSGVPADVAELARATQREIRRGMPTVDQLAIVRENWSLRQYWTEFMRPDQERRVKAGDLARNSLNHVRDAITAWETLTRPADRPAKSDWPGFPIGTIEARYLTDALNRYRQGRSLATVRGWWGHLRTIFNHAVMLKAIPSAPKPQVPAMAHKKAKIFTDDQIAEIYAALGAVSPTLQVAFVLAVNAGMRPVDLFCLRWDNLDRQARTITFTARKTGSLQTIPLPDVALRHLDRLQGRSPLPYIFYHVAEPTAKDPERSRAARNRNDRFKQALRGLGLATTKPWQACRATCNTRLESHRPGVGKFVLGHSCSDVNAKHYFEPTAVVFEAINSVPQPDCFSNF